MEHVNKLRKGKELFQDLLFEYEKIYIYTKLDDKIKANQMYEIILEKLKTFVPSREINNIYHMIARYLVYIKDYEKALEYYEYVYKNINIYHGYRRITLIEIANLYETMGYKDKALKAKNESIELLNNSLNVVSSILSDESGLYSDKFSNLAYQELYNKTDILNTFFNKLSSHLTLIEINNELNTTLKALESHAIYKLIIYNEFIKSYVYFDKGNEAIASSLKDIPIDKKLTNRVSLLSNEKIVGYLFLEDLIYNNSDISKNNLTKLYYGLANAISSHFSFEKIEFESNHDILTGLLSRRGFNLELAKLSKINSNYFIVTIDIDDFKYVNDQYGHPAGDEVIIGVSQMLKKHLGAELLARTGGDEFLVIKECNKNNLEKAFKNLLEDLSKTKFTYNNNAISVTISIGAKNCTNDFSNSFKDADELLYKIKENGKNNYLIVEA